MPPLLPALACHPFPPPTPPCLPTPTPRRSEFNKEPRFYFPHNVDFRGRAYPMHPHLNHLGSDLSRGLLQFADGKPLGERGMF